MPEQSSRRLKPANAKYLKPNYPTILGDKNE